MKLRNKKTRKIGELYYYPDKEYCFTIRTKDPADTLIYKTIGGIWYDWEDYIPHEPLIKDEKVRKIILAWLESLKDAMIDGIITFYVCNAYQTFQVDVLWKMDNIKDIAELDLIFDYDGLEDGKRYNIEELCGEEEE